MSCVRACALLNLSIYTQFYVHNTYKVEYKVDSQFCLAEKQTQFTHIIPLLFLTTFTNSCSLAMITVNAEASGHTNHISIQLHLSSGSHAALAV